MISAFFLPQLIDKIVIYVYIVCYTTGLKREAFDLTLQF